MRHTAQRLSQEAEMNQPARNIHLPLIKDTVATTSLSLRVLSMDADPGLCSPGQAAGVGRHYCLVYLVPLERPKINSTLARRVRLRDSLAGNNPSRNADILARDPHFWDYLQQFNLTAYDTEIDARRSRHFINRACCIGGRHELDRDPAAGQRFFTLIEQPFLDWLFACGMR
jgi:hypothetical protein